MVVRKNLRYQYEDAAQTFVYVSGIQGRGFNSGGNLAAASQ